MGFLNLFKKKSVPDELPELATDEIREELESEELEEHKDVINDYLKKEESTKVKEEVVKEGEPQEVEKVKEVMQQPSITKESENESFFNELQGDLIKEISDLNKLEKWYNDKFLPRDIVSDMRGYWENQKAKSIIQILGKNFQEKISEKIIALQGLEKEWQDIYFHLVEKEEEIRDLERDLKKMLKEFIELCKRRKEKKNKKTK